jgi:uncharacterized protein
MKDFVKAVERMVQLIMPPEPVHGFPHVKRVHDLALKLARSYKDVIDLEALEIAAYLHDIGRMGELGEEDHAAASAEVAEFLMRLAGYPPDKIEKVKDAILGHSFSSGRRPKTLEGKLLSDADKLDALGAVGIARVFMYSGYKGRGLKDSINHFREKIVRLPQQMLTDEGRKEAEERIRIVLDFLNALEAELSH